MPHVFATTFGLTTSDHARLVVENNYAEHDVSDAPAEFFNTYGTEIVLSGNYLGSTDGSEHATGDAFGQSDYYDYTVETAAQARRSVMGHAGIQED